MKMTKNTNRTCKTKIKYYYFKTKNLGKLEISGWFEKSKILTWNQNCRSKRPNLIIIKII